ncbi:MAG: contractile injection system protein, VgrG/Pvc8 family [Pseudomonadota bacterium]
MPDLGTTSLLYSARPTLTLDGQERGDLREALLTLAVTETWEGLAHAEVAFGAWGTAAGEPGLLYMDRSEFDFGQTFEIAMGEASASQSIFKGRITGIEGRFPAARPPQMSVLAEDPLQDLRMIRRSRVFEDIDDAGIFERVASDHGLTPNIDVSGPQHRAIAQLNQSDLAFLRSRARAVDAELWVTDGTLNVQARARRETDRIELTYGRGLHEFSVLADLSHQRTAMRIGGWDVAAAEAMDVTAGAEVVTSDPGAGPSGPDLLAAQFGDRIEAEVHHAMASIDEAQTCANARMAQIARQFITGRGTAEGDGRIRVGTILTLRGIGAMFDGDYYVTETCHEMDDTAGYRTQFTVERAKLEV